MQSLVFSKLKFDVSIGENVPPIWIYFKASCYCRWSTELLPVLEGDDWALDMLELQLGSPAFAKVSG